ncbi:MAG: UDP-N-acetylmuramoyl-L-alanyl-D-glutamate--2,6-diaminopimelate ligase [Bacteroidetes bacterium]|nr:UDP-N-acetylmuramoyl-L-alanyl-D-glutamate--2,6-diaminopimelate ligase [Bacteroidota bacterium]
MKKLSKIVPQHLVLESRGDTNIMVSSLQFDSRQVMPGDVFVAVRGSVSDGHNFIGMAIEKGASAIVCESCPVEMPGFITWIRTADSALTLGEMASAFYNHPSHKLQLVGITGTNGKTTTVTLLHSLFTELGYKAGLLSTIKNLVNQRGVAATHTTADPIQVNRLLNEMCEEGCEYCFMEVSSHAVDQKRIAGLRFRGAIFSNLTHDHLDYHRTFDAYLKAKKGFFDGLPDSAFALVNKDDKNGLVMLQNTRAAKFTYSLQSMADFRCRIVENEFTGLHLSINGQDVWFRLIGSFNAYNILSVYAAAVLLGQESFRVLTLLSRTGPVEGRFNYINGPGNITAIIDYAHTPDALKNVLETINDIRHHNEKLITVVGAGGNRDTTKRPVMARISASLSDQLILTSDNPRFEEPEAILEEMVKGIEVTDARKVLVIADRRQAIKTAVTLAGENDIILVAGKGHETYQEIKGVKYPFDDREIVKELLSIKH